MWRPNGLHIVNILGSHLFPANPDFVGGGAFGGDVGGGIGDEFGKFSRGGAVVEAVEVGVFLEGDETVLVDMVHRTLYALFERVG